MKKIEETYTEKLCRWSNTLNGWKWPKDLPGKPDNFDEMPAFIQKSDEWEITKHAFVTGIMGDIGRRVGAKESLKWHHIHNLGRTIEEFNGWWKEHYEHNK